MGWIVRSKFRKFLFSSYQIKFFEPAGPLQVFLFYQLDFYIFISGNNIRASASYILSYVIYILTSANNIGASVSYILVYVIYILASANNIRASVSYILVYVIYILASGNNIGATVFYILNYMNNIFPFKIEKNLPNPQKSARNHKAF